MLVHYNIGIRTYSGICLGFRQQTTLFHQIGQRRRGGQLRGAQHIWAPCWQMLARRGIIKRPHSLPSLRACFWPMSNDYLGFFGMINEGSHAIVIALVGFFSPLRTHKHSRTRDSVALASHKEPYQRLIMGAYYSRAFWSKLHEECSGFLFSKLTKLCRTKLEGEKVLFTLQP